jgi:hypothetical protein
MKRIYYPAFVFLLIFLIFSAVNAQEIKIKTVDGVQVVINPKNPAPPEGTPTKMVLKEDFSIGEEDQEEEIFSQMSAVTVDDKGNIYILDREENIIKIFDSKGKFLRSFGKQGQGPGEMNGPIGLRITPDNELMVEDTLNQRLAFFSLDGKFLRQLSTAKALGLALVRIDSKGNIMGQQIVTAEGKITREVKKYDSELNPLFTIAALDFPNVLTEKFNPFDLIFYSELAKDDTIYYGNLKEYKIEVFNPDGKIIKRILKEYNPVKITEKDKEEYLARLPSVAVAFKDRIEFPKNYPACQSFSLDDQGRLIVRTWERGKERGEFYYDVFDSEGRYIAKILLDVEPMVWKASKLYAVEETEDGYHILRVYSVNWE